MGPSPLPHKGSSDRFPRLAPPAAYSPPEVLLLFSLLRIALAPHDIDTAPPLPSPHAASPPAAGSLDNMKSTTDHLHRDAPHRFLPAVVVLPGRHHLLITPLPLLLIILLPMMVILLREAPHHHSSSEGYPHLSLLSPL